MVNREHAPTGRRPGQGNATRDAILRAARESFAEAGYDRASVRKIATAAGVDPALVLHYFGSKDGLFAEAVSLPLDPDELGERIFGPGIAGSGARFVHAFLEIWESDALGTQVRGVMRAAASNDEAAQRLRAFIQAEVLRIPDRFLAQPDARLRLTLAASHLVGLAFARYILAVEPLASVPRSRLERSVAPAIQHYLSGDLAASGGLEEETQ